MQQQSTLSVTKKKTIFETEVVPLRIHQAKHKNLVFLFFKKAYLCLGQKSALPA